MNYVLLDTNIIIDMVVDRRNQIDNKLLNKFLKLLEFDEIKLIVPEIVKTETYRHLDKEIDNVGIQIQKVLDDIGKLYGVSTLEIEGLDLSVYKKNARKELNAALTLFESKREAYKDDIFKSIDLIFNSMDASRSMTASLSLPSTGHTGERSKSPPSHSSMARRRDSIKSTKPLMSAGSFPQFAKNAASSPMTLVSRSATSGSTLSKVSSLVCHQ